MRRYAFAQFDETSLPSDHESLDRRLAAALWAWCDDPASVQDRRDEIGGLMEWFLCDAFRHSPDGRQRNWWSDGVTLVELERTGDSAFFGAGATIWADSNSHRGFHLAPFEVEFYFASRGDRLPKKVVVRFGELDVAGRIIERPWDTTATKIVANRPTSNDRWAMVIELTNFGGSG